MTDQFDTPSGNEQLPEQPANPQALEGGAVQPVSAEDYGSLPRRRRFAAWMVLVPILVLVIGLYAGDRLLGKNRQEKAFDRIQDILPRQQTSELQMPGAAGGGRRQESEPPPKIISTDAVHKLIGREPDLVEKASERINDEMQPVLVETYRFPGVIESYNVVVTYLLDDSVKDDPLTALKFVRKQDQPRIGTVNGTVNGTENGTVKK